MDRRPDTPSAQRLTAMERRAFAIFAGTIGGALLAWILAELTVRVTSYADLLHIAIAIAGGVAGGAFARWRAPRDERAAPSA